MTDLSNVTLGSEFGPEFDFGTIVPGKISLRVGDGVTRNADGSITIDAAYVQALLPAGTGGGDRVTAIGFDATTEVLSLSIIDGTQVTGALSGVVTEQKLIGQKVALRSVFGTEVPAFRGLPA